MSPRTVPVVVHVLAEIHPSAVVADVDNLLKPVLDALAGVAYVNDAQVVECLVRKLPSLNHRLLVKLWFCGEPPARLVRQTVPIARGLEGAP